MLGTFSALLFVVENATMSTDVMNSQATTRVEISARIEPWVSFLRAHAAITRELSAQLQRRYRTTRQ